MRQFHWPQPTEGFQNVSDSNTTTCMLLTQLKNQLHSWRERFGSKLSQDSRTDHLYILSPMKKKKWARILSFVVKNLEDFLPMSRSANLQLPFAHNERFACTILLLTGTCTTYTRLKIRYLFCDLGSSSRNLCFEEEPQVLPPSTRSITQIQATFIRLSYQNNQHGRRVLTFYDQVIWRQLWSRILVLIWVTVFRWPQKTLSSSFDVNVLLNWSTNPSLESEHERILKTKKNIRVIQFEINLTRKTTESSALWSPFNQEKGYWQQGKFNDLC